MMESIGSTELVFFNSTGDFVILIPQLLLLSSCSSLFRSEFAGAETQKLAVLLYSEAAYM